MKWSLKTRLTLWIGCVMTGFITSVFAWMHYGLQSILDAKNQSFLLVESHELQAAVRDDTAGGVETLEAQIRREVGAFTSEGLIVLQCKKEKNEVFPATDANLRIASGFQSFINQDFSEPVEITIDQKPFLVYRTWIKHVETEDFPLYLILSLAETRQILSQFDRRGMTGGLAFLAIAVAGGYLFSIKALQPVRRSIQSAKRLEPDNLSERLQISGTGDELDQLAATINGLLDRLADYHIQIVRFTADASHELRSPLGAMRTMVEVALQKNRTADEYRDVLESLGELFDTLSHMIDSMLLLAKADAGELELKRTRLNIQDLVFEIMDLFQPVAEEKNIRFDYICEEPDMTITGDKQRIRQLLINLVDNAIKFTNPDGNIIIHTRKNAGYAEIVVENSGIGVKDDQLDLIFERFYQVDTARSSKGTGLGLSICKWICTAHGGQIKAKNLSPVGFQVVASLPAHSAAKKPAQIEITSSSNVTQ